MLIERDAEKELEKQEDFALKSFNLIQGSSLLKSENLDQAHGQDLGQVKQK